MDTNMNKGKYMIYYMSDIHLEINGLSLQLYEAIKKARNNFTKNNINILILAGDIAHPDKIFDSFLQYVSEIFTWILYIAGNHEYYKGDISSRNKLFRSMCNK